MKLYHLSQNVETGYDTYSDIVVCAASEEIARTIHPNWRWNNIKSDVERAKCWSYNYSGWAKHPDQVLVEYLGEAHDDLEEGVICASFHAG